ncbi:MAG: hypothetical protein ACYCW6_10450 [Candidatus Xenobia bacterium]
MRRGMALMVALMFSLFVLVLMLSLLAFIERDDRFSAVEEQNSEAYDAAMAGIECFKLKCNTVQAGQALTGSLTPVESFAVSVDPQGNVVSIGTVTNLDGKVLATRRVFVPVLTYEDIQDGSQ